MNNKDFLLGIVCFTELIVAYGHEEQFRIDIATAMNVVEKELEKMGVTRDEKVEGVEWLHQMIVNYFKKKAEEPDEEWDLTF